MGLQSHRASASFSGTTEIKEALQALAKLQVCRNCTLLWNYTVFLVMDLEEGAHVKYRPAFVQLLRPCFLLSSRSLTNCQSFLSSREKYDKPFEVVYGQMASLQSCR